jgi:hypothetical protein
MKIGNSSLDPYFSLGMILRLNTEQLQLLKDFIAEKNIIVIHNKISGSRIWLKCDEEIIEENKGEEKK